jgi:hypothetical protein
LPATLMLVASPAAWARLMTAVNAGTSAAGKATTNP